MNLSGKALIPRLTLGTWLLTLLGAGLCLVLYSGLLPDKVRVLHLQNIRHEIGRAYLGQLSTSEYSSHLSPSPGVLREDNKPLGPANALHDDIRKLGGGRFSLWHGHVYFSTSDNSDPRSNGRSYQVVAPYFGHQSVLLLKYGTLFLGSAALLLTLLLVARYPDSHVRLVRFIWLLLRLVPLALGLGLLLYLLLALYALGKGESLYLAWPLTRLNLSFFVEQVESRLPALLVDWAFVAWLFSFLAANSAQEPLAQRAKRSLSFWYTWLGLPAVIGLFALHTGAIWYAPESMRTYAIGSSLAGIIPFSDAKGHFQLNHMFAATGEFHFWLMRRPLAAAMRVGLDWLGGYNPFHVLGLQAALLGASAWLLGLTLLRRWGVFAAVCVVALVMTYARNFQASYLVHSLGVAWGCLAMALMVEFLYLRRLGSYLAGLGSLTVALLVRMGAMFLSPALALWLAWTQRRNWKKALALLAGSLAVMGVAWAGSTFVMAVHGHNANQQGANFASIAAGLSIDANWAEATARYRDQLNDDPKHNANRLYAIALANLADNPLILFQSLYHRAEAFFLRTSVVVAQGLGGQARPLFIIILPLLAVMRLWFFPRQMVSFWLWSLLAVLLSAAVVYYAEGHRSLAVGYVVVQVFLASALREDYAAPRDWSPAPPAQNRLAVWLSLICTALFVYMLLAPSLAYNFPPPQARAWRQQGQTHLAPGESILWGGDSLLGVLVVADNQPLPPGLPALHLSSFVRSVRNCGVELHYQKLVTPSPPGPPFALILAPPTGSYIYIAPPFMLERKRVLLWKVKFVDWYGGPQPDHFRLIVSAEPYEGR